VLLLSGRPMGNVCRVPSEADASRDSCAGGQTHCLLSQQSYCCTAEDDCVGAFEYHRLEEESSNRVPLSEASNNATASASHLPRAAAAAQAVCWPSLAGGYVLRTHPAKMFAPPTQVDAPAAASKTRSRMVYENEVILDKAPSGKTGEGVFVHLYDLSDALAQINSVAIDIMGIGGALHVGVEVFGVEYSFGTGGVSCSVPKQNRHYAFRQTVNMGLTPLSRAEIEQAMHFMLKDWPGSGYDLFSKNCGTFCQALCVRIGVGSLPPWVNRIAEAGGRSATFRRIIDMMAQKAMSEEASPESQTSQSQSDCSQGAMLSVVNTESDTSYLQETPRFVSPSSHEELLWLSHLSGEDWLEEELNCDLRLAPPLCPSEVHSRDDACHAPPLARHSRDGAGLHRSSSVFADVPSPVRGSPLCSSQRCATFRASSYPPMNSPQRTMAFEHGADREMAFCEKRLALGPRVSSKSRSAMMAITARGGG